MTVYGWLEVSPQSPVANALRQYMCVNIINEDFPHEHLTNTPSLLKCCLRKPRATSLSHQVLYGGAWEGDFDHLLSLLEAELEESKKETKDKRSAGHNARGRQLTPAFVEAVLRDVLADPEAEAGKRNVTNPRGGFTDVGLHTGGERRNTAWPLVRLYIHMSFTDLRSVRIYVMTILMRPRFSEVSSTC